MDFNADTPRRNRTISGVEITVPEVYAEGQTIGAGEASMLNQTIAENVSNNLRDRIAKFLPEGAPEGTEPRQATVEEAQALVDAYLANYTPGVRSGGGGAPRLTPLDRKVRELATAKLQEVLAAKGKKRKDVDFNALRDSIIEAHGEALRKRAQTLLDAEAKASAGIGSDDILATVADGL